LRLTGVQQYKQPRVVGIGGIVDQSVEEICGRDRRVVRETDGVSHVESDRVGTVLQQIACKDQIDAGDRRVAKREISLGVRAKRVEIERGVRRIRSAVIKDDDQSRERGIPDTAVVKLDELQSIGTRRVRVDLVNEDRIDRNAAVCESARRRARVEAESRMKLIWRVRIYEILKIRRRRLSRKAN